MATNHLTTNDLNLAVDSDFHLDFRHLSFHDGQFDVVAFDPPYKLNGTPALGDFNAAYGIAQPTNWRERMDMMADGLVECLRVSSRLVLVKCQDQVCSGRIRWQTFELTATAVSHGANLLDRFTMLGGTREQPEGRRQVHARDRGSTLLVFQK